jgi:hypothetical protein
MRSSSVGKVSQKVASLGVGTARMIGMSGDWRRWYDGAGKIRFLEGIAMTPRPSAPDSLPTDAFQGEAAGEPSSTTGPPTAGEPQPAEWPYRDVDPRTGRLRPISAEELQARYEELRKRLAEIDAEDDTPDEVYDEVLRGIDEERRRQGRPPAFEGCY